MPADYDYIVGIDPDTNQSGLAIYVRATGELRLYELGLFEIYDLFSKCREEEETFFVRLEAGHTVKSTWHKGGNGMAKRVGANHEIGRQLEKLLKKLDIPYELVKPCGFSDYSHQMFCQITKWPLSAKTNPEKRVAGLLCYNY
jgi:hypothetical protein